MKWFKHEVDAIHSEKLTRLKNDFGFEGCGRYWRIMELVAERMDGSDRCHIELPEKEWLSLLSMRRPLFDRYLVVIGLLFDSWRITRDNERLLIRIEIPNLLKKRDNYTSDLQASSKKLPNRSRSRKEVEEPFCGSPISTGKTLVNFYHDEFFRILEIKPDMNFGRDGQILQGLANAHGEEKLKELITKFLSSTDQWISSTDRSVKVFKSQVQKLLLGKGVAKMNPQLVGY